MPRTHEEVLKEMAGSKTLSEICNHHHQAVKWAWDEIRRLRRVIKKSQAANMKIAMDALEFPDGDPDA